MVVKVATPSAAAMEKTKPRDDDISGATEEELVRTIGDSKSGQTIIEALTELDSRVRTVEGVRARLFGDRITLSRLISSHRDRRHKKMAESTRKRFMPADQLLLQTIGSWDHDFASSFPTFAAWVAFQRTKGFDIPQVSEIKSSQAADVELRLVRLRKDLASVATHLSLAMGELDSLIEIFTPSLDEAFADCDNDFKDDVVRGPSSIPTELDGFNDEMFRTAREKFGYVTKKLVPRLIAIADEASKMALAKGIGDEAQRLIDKTQGSKTYQNFLLLLSSNAASPEDNKSARKDRRIDHQYDEWF